MLSGQKIFTSCLSFKDPQRQKSLNQWRFQKTATNGYKDYRILLANSKAREMKEIQTVRYVSAPKIWWCICASCNQHLKTFSGNKSVKQLVNYFLRNCVQQSRTSTRWWWHKRKANERLNWKRFLLWEAWMHSVNSIAIFRFCLIVAKILRNFFMMKKLVKGTFWPEERSEDH